jgi:guanylate kinase
MSYGVILYGPPASGKDTITAALTTLNPAFQMFARVKVGPGKVESYRMRDLDDLAALRASGDIVWENSRYGATYIIDKSGLVEALANSVPVVHLGQSGGVEAVVKANPEVSWTVAYLWCPRAVARQRLIDRGSTNVTERLEVWAGTPELLNCDIRIDTSEKSPTETAALIQAVEGGKWG